MGRSAKLHKRVKKTKLPGGSSSSTTATGSSMQNQAQTAKKKASLKDKTPRGSSGKGDGPVLGGADYVSLLVGGRRKAREEAAKLPVGDEN